MDTEAVRWFHLVAGGTTVTEVAHLFGVSQPAVSRGLARLEADIGTPLLQKSGRLLRPTYAGEVFRRHVDTMLRGLDDGLGAVAELVDPRAGTVSVGFQLSLGTWLVPQMIERFRAEYPRVRFRLEQSDDALGSSLVAGGRIDLEFTARRPRNPAVRWERLFAQRLYLVVPQDHRFAGRDSVALADTADEEFVMLRPTWELRALSDELCAEAGFAPRVAFEVDDLPVLHGFVAAGLGVGIVPAGEDEPQQTGAAAVMIRLRDPRATRDVGLAWSRERRLLPSADLFRRHALATAPGSQRGTQRGDQRERGRPRQRHSRPTASS